MVKKLEKGATVTCFKCHQEGHKSYKCPQPKKMVPDEKNKKSFTIKSSLIYTKPNRRNKSRSTSYVIKKKSNGKVVAHEVGKKDWSTKCDFKCIRCTRNLIPSLSIYICVRLRFSCLNKRGKSFYIFYIFYSFSFSLS
jgi:hypothetical protein